MKKIIQISEATYINMFLNNLVVRKNDTKIIIPTSNIETIIFENERSTISLPLLNELVNLGVNIIFCDRKHLPNALLIPYQGYYSTKVLQKQLQWDDDFKGNLWTSIVKLKIKNSKNILEKINLLNDDLKLKFDNYINSVQYLDVSNVEGHVAKLYFKILFGSSYRRDDENNVINQYLNYGYSILTSYVTRHLSSKGYDTRIGLFHKSYNNNFPLSCDIMEPFRCLIDLLVYKYWKNTEFHNFQEFKEQLFLIFEENIIVENKKMSFSKYIQIFIEDLLTNQNNKRDLSIDPNY
ncbi:type II CRISPR-associated endonuclease Cas1 [Mycoplasma sp. Mirounga ES2805-ORL]|uniref:type II CRISPR-associated endonuclease Cas1 n=1 Tax=Mycoplasma sp. Mirounga ES2805-ORL TaxID=754514 RepID=UPI00197B4654|nr:type II CRISPR-associated endonuclease Cas1 [Mycoplasma sp. Mirounga ES2805-ORL]QSF13703.1 type II CRISPR-associated endonuclease Cas1 [Mycoplasma sp. Mirounga ES2805-ORL]